MRISILTLFPEMFAGPFEYSIVKRARGRNAVDIRLVNIRDFATDNYKTVDDKPYGGGTGMILRVDVVHKAIEHTLDKTSAESGQKTVLLDPKGTTFTQRKAAEYAALKHIVLVCGHYEGVDARTTHFVDESLSIGNYILTGGEIPAMAVVDATVRLIPGVLSKDATKNESFSKNLPAPHKNRAVFEYLQYTRPAEYQGLAVPDVLLSGNHKKIAAWRKRHTVSSDRYSDKT